MRFECNEIMQSIHVVQMFIVCRCESKTTVSTSILKNTMTTFHVIDCLPYPNASHMLLTSQ